ncbi:Spore germination protein B1 [bioreactor metagenome]|uniref:Spore germination protein B1 n=1 Tax=bioreactor metagenome TaxID=1076179 RepID=A0A644WZI8_9ZZZZ
MGQLFQNRRQKKINNRTEQMNKNSEDNLLSDSFDKNIQTVSSLFEDVDILRIKYIENNHDKNQKYCIIFCDGMVNASIINESIIKPLMLSCVSVKSKDMLDTIVTQIIQIGKMEKTNKINDVVEAIAGGDTILFVDGTEQALILNAKGFQTRSITEPDNEKNLNGPREGFTESLMLNLSMIRRKVLTSDLKMKYYSLGQRTNTKACICYMKGIVNNEILAELYRRLDEIKIDGMLDTNYITELIKDAQLSPFRTTGYTERPDVVIGKLLEGRIAIFLDGTPDVLTIPYLFIENFQSSEDYYLSFFYSSFSRLLRIIGFFLTVTVPALYIAVVAFHQEMMPMNLFISIAAERQSVPFPAALEAFLMLIVFDILRETGIRMPTNTGQALSIVGALVIGQAAVEAKLVAAPMIIVVALTGITNLLIPKMNAPVIYVRLMLLALASCFGFFGLILGISCVLIHVINLRSFGIPQVTLSGNLKYQKIKDIIIRAPWWQMIQRPGFAGDNVRMKNGGNQHD